MSNASPGSQSKEIARNKIATDTAAFIEGGGTVKQCTWEDNQPLQKLSRKECISNLKRKDTAVIEAERARKLDRVRNAYRT